MKTSHLFLGLAAAYVAANAVAYAKSDIVTVTKVFEVFGLYVPPLLVVPTFIGWQVTGRPKPVAFGLFVVVVLLVAGVNIFFVWLIGSSAK